MKIVPETPLRVLQYAYGGSQKSGIESYLVEAYRGIDVSKTQFDFLFRYESPIEDQRTELEERGARIHALGIDEGLHVVRKQWRELVGLWGFFRKNRYDAVEVNMTSVFMCLQAVIIAGLHGTTVRIVHAHDSLKHEKFHKRIIKGVGKPLLRVLSTDRWGCSRDAVAYLFGRGAVVHGRWTLVKNAIDVDRFVFSPSERRRIRAEFGLENARVIGVVGRLTPQKNHRDAVRVFESLARHQEDVQLVIVGDGPLFEDVAAMVKSSVYADRMHMVGARTDIPAWLSAFDVLLATSQHEGFPLVSLEAQDAGLPVVASDAYPVETNLEGGVTRLSLEAPMSDWVAALIAASRKPREDGRDTILRHGYDRSSTAAVLDALYRDARTRVVAGR